jgi:uncharacterized protein YbaR (Trm112 family)
MSEPGALAAELLAILACPACKGPVEATAGGDAILCPACRRRYPVRDEVAILLADEAEPDGAEADRS